MNSTTKLILLFLFTLSLTSYGQDIDELGWFGDDYEDGLYLSLGANNVRISNNKAPNSDNHKFSGTTFKLDLKDINFEAGESSYYFENKLLGDIVYYATGIFNGSDDIYQDEESGITSGLLGWHSMLWNITEPRRYQISIGANFSDFFLTSAYPEDESKPYNNISNTIVQEPNGNYYAIGPSASYRFMISSFLLLEYVLDISIPFGKLDSENLVDYDGKYKNPYFHNQSVELISSKGLFVGYEHTGLINRGNLPNNTKRNELYVGLRIRLN